MDKRQAVRKTVGRGVKTVKINIGIKRTVRVVLVNRQLYLLASQVHQVVLARLRMILIGITRSIETDLLRTRLSPLVLQAIFNVMSRKWRRERL